MSTKPSSQMNNIIYLSNHIVIGLNYIVIHLLFIGIPPGGHPISAILCNTESVAGFVFLNVLWEGL